MINIDQNKCVGCGQCMKDCFIGDIEMAVGKAQPKNDQCFNCGHCVAVCPANAVEVQGYDMEQVTELADMDLGPMDRQEAAQICLNQLKARRTIRRYKDKPLTNQQLEMIIEAGRYAPTGSNRQNVAYHIIRDRMPEMKTKMMDQLKHMADTMETTDPRTSFYIDMWKKMHEEYHQEGKDRLFFDAPAVIVLSSDDPMSAGIAAAHMETVIYAMGLGMLYSGFGRLAVDSSPEIREELQIRDKYHAQVVMVVGYPAVTYRRTAPRKKARVAWC